MVPFLKINLGQLKGNLKQSVTSEFSALGIKGSLTFIIRESKLHGKSKVQVWHWNWESKEYELLSVS